MAKTEAPTIVEECAVPRCGYVVYGDPENEAHVKDGALKLKAHMREHEDPDGWKADAEAAALEEMD
jgi:hypothetical protein